MFRILIGLSIVAVSLANTVLQGGVPMLDGRVIAGEDVNILQYPHQASLLYNGVHICGGSIVGPSSIVTAAHCVFGRNANKLTITVGSTTLKQLGPNSQVLSVQEFVIHPGYNRYNNDYDVAVLSLDGSLEFNEFVQPIKPSTERPREGSLVTVTGWGVSSNNLQKVEVNVIGKHECQSSYYLWIITDRMLCGGDDFGGEDVCHGDSGGPMIYNDQLVGILSWGQGCGRFDTTYVLPGVYTSISAVQDFVTENIM